MIFIDNIELRIERGEQGLLNNSPRNLIPLCPTHHQYWHSKFRHLVEPQIEAYLQKWKPKG